MNSPPPPAEFVLVHRDRQGRETTHPLDGERFTIGRARYSDICITSQFVSRQHALLSRLGDGWVYQDLDSTSGSYVEGSQVTRTRLPTDTWVHLGTPAGHALRVQRVEPPPAGADAVGGLAGDLSAPGSRTEILRTMDLDQSRYVALAATVEDIDLDQVSHQRLGALYELGGNLTASRSRDEIFERVLDAALDQLPAERGAMLVQDPGTPEPRAVAVRIGGRSGVDFQPSRVLTAMVMRDSVGIVSRDAPTDASLPQTETLAFQAVRSVMVAPVSSMKRVWGAIYIDSLSVQTPYDEEMLEFLLAVGRQVGLTLESLYLLTEQERMLESLMEVLAASIDARDGMTAGHSSRVAGYARRLAERLGWDADACKRLYWAGLLHDYGKIGIDDAVLRKPGRLDTVEFEAIREHPRLTHDILRKIHFPEDLTELPFIAATHHERLDGRGYPFGLEGEDFPIAGQIIGIADVFDALTQERHYRQPMTLSRVVDILEDGRDVRWGARIVDAFVALIDEELADELGDAGPTDPDGGTL